MQKQRSYGAAFAVLLATIGLSYVAYATCDCVGTTNTSSTDNCPGTWPGHLKTWTQYIQNGNPYNAFCTSTPAPNNTGLCANDTFAQNVTKNYKTWKCDDTLMSDVTLLNQSVWKKKCPSGGC